MWMKTFGCSWYRWRGPGLRPLLGLLTTVTRLLSFTFNTQETEYFHQQQIDNLSFLRQLKREKEPCDIHRTILFGGFSFFLRGTMVLLSSLVSAKVTSVFRVNFVLGVPFWESQGCVLLPLSPGGSFFPCDENDKIPSITPQQRLLGMYVQRPSCIAAGNVKLWEVVCWLLKI